MEYESRLAERDTMRLKVVFEAGQEIDQETQKLLE
jgi:hypothetical protein